MRTEPITHEHLRALAVAVRDGELRETPPLNRPVVSISSSANPGRRAIPMSTEVLCPF